MNRLRSSRPKIVAATLMALFPISFVAAIPWLRNQPEETVYLFSGIAATGTVLASFVLAVLKDKELDEWHRGAARFSNQWGWVAGGGLIAILQSLPAAQNLIVTLTTSVATGSEPVRPQIIFAFMLGFMAVIIAQMICTLVLSKGWRSWMSREAS